MRILLSLLAIAALVTVAHAGGAMWWDIDAARTASEIEIKIHSNGTIEDVEYHVPVATVPTAVVQAMDGLYPGVTPTAAEKEYEGGELFYELAVVVGGKKHEVMFTPAGKAHSKEIQVDENDPKYPDLPAIQADILAKYAGATNVVLEVILDAADALVEYHIKLVTDNGTPAEKHHKLIVTKDGFLAGAYLEVAAEIEVPIPPR